MRCLLSVAGFLGAIFLGYQPLAEGQMQAQWTDISKVDDFTDELQRGLSLDSTSDNWEGAPANLYFGCNEKRGIVDSLLSLPVRSKTKYNRGAWFLNAKIRLDDGDIQEKVLIGDIRGQTMLFWAGDYLDPVFAASRLRIRVPGIDKSNTMSFDIPQNSKPLDEFRAYCAAQKK